MADRAQLFQEVKAANTLNEDQSKQIVDLEQENKTLKLHINDLEKQQSTWKLRSGKQFIASASNGPKGFIFTQRETTVYDYNLNRTSTN